MDDVVVMRSQLTGALATKFQVRDRVAQEVVTLIVNNIQKTLEQGGVLKFAVLVCLCQGIVRVA